MKRLQTILLVGGMLLLSNSVWAAPGVTIAAADGQVRQHIWGAPSPTPGYCYWDHDQAPEPFFHATNQDGYGNMGCPDEWLVHCDGDSLVFRGSWPRLDQLYVLSAEYLVDLSCTLVTTSEIRLQAERWARVGDPADPGSLDVDEHTLVLTLPTGEVITLLAAGIGPAEVDFALPVGSYRLDLHVNARKDRSPDHIVNAYAGGIMVTWSEAAVAVDDVSWSALKASFRK